METPFPIYFDQALNCARILSRILPFLLENESPVIKDLLWGRRFVTSTSQGNDGGESKNGAGEDTQESEPLAVILVNTMFHLLFLPDFTIDDPNIEFSPNDVNSPEFKAALMWAPGVGKPFYSTHNVFLHYACCHVNPLFRFCSENCPQFYSIRQ